MPAEPRRHHAPNDLADRFALSVTRLLRFFADTFFARRYGHRAIVLETVAAVPGMVGAMVTHLHCLRRMVSDDGWIRTLMEEAENERMHLMTFVEVARPTALERFLILGAQWIFYLGFFSVSRFAPHRASSGRLFRGGSGPQLHAVSGGDRCRSRTQRLRPGDRKTVLEAGGRRDAARRGDRGSRRRGASPGRQPRAGQSACRTASRVRTGHTVPGTRRLHAVSGAAGVFNVPCAAC